MASPSSTFNFDFILSCSLWLLMIFLNFYSLVSFALSCFLLKHSIIDSILFCLWAFTLCLFTRLESFMFSLFFLTKI